MDLVKKKLSFNESEKFESSYGGGLSAKIKAQTGLPINWRTLRAMDDPNVNYRNDYFSETYINALASVLGVGSWRIFINSYGEITKNKPVFNHHQFDDADDLAVGEYVIIGWRPDRYLKLKYLDDCKFEVCESTSIVHVVGSIIETRWFEVRLDECAEGVFGSQARIWACFRDYSEVLYI